MSDENKWNECACGESISVTESEFGQMILTQWQQAHAKHEGKADGPVLDR